MKAMSRMEKEHLLAFYRDISRIGVVQGQDTLELTATSTMEQWKTHMETHIMKCDKGVLDKAMEAASSRVRA